MDRAVSAPEPTARTPHPFGRRELVLLAAITALAAALRLYKLGEWSFWVDEAHTFRDTIAPWERFWSSHVSAYPLSYLTARAFLELLGAPSSEGWMRLPFVFFGILSVPVLGLVGRQIVGRGTALVAALFLAVSPWHVYWSQNARSYSMVVFFGLLAAGSFYAFLQSRRGLVLVGAVVATLLAGLCHPSAYLLLAAFMVYAAHGPIFGGRHGRQARAFEKWLPLGLLALLAGVLAVLLPVVQHVLQAKPEFSLMHLVQTTIFYVRTPVLAAAVGGLLFLFDRGDRAAPFLTAWLAVPLLVLAVLAGTAMKVTAQYAFYTLPAFCLLAAVAVVTLAEGFAARGFRGLLLRVIPAAILLCDMVGHDYLYFEKYHGERPRWREAALFVQRQADGPLRVLTTNGPSMSYYLDPESILKPSPGGAVVQMNPWDLNDPEEGVTPDRYIARYERRARRDGVDLYVIVTEPELYEMDPRGLASDYLRARFHQIRRYPNWTGPKDMTVLVYRMPR